MHWSKRRVRLERVLLAGGVFVPLACQAPNEPHGTPKVALPSSAAVAPAAAPVAAKAKIKIKTLSLSTTTLTIAGTPPNPTYTVVIQNTGPDATGISLQAEIVQDPANYRGAGGTNVACGAASGVLPKGTCTMTSVFSVSNVNGGGGSLVAGAATFRLTLFQFDGTTTTTLDVQSVPVTLNGILFTSIATPFGPDTLRINADSLIYSSVTFANSTGVTQDSVAVRATFQQVGHATRVGFPRLVDCGVIPVGTAPAGSCNTFIIAKPTNSAFFPDTLVAGASLLHLDIVQRTVATVRDRRTFVVQLK